MTASAPELSVNIAMLHCVFVNKITRILLNVSRHYGQSCETPFTMSRKHVERDGECVIENSFERAVSACQGIWHKLSILRSVMS